MYNKLSEKITQVEQDRVTFPTTLNPCPVFVSTCSKKELQRKTYHLYKFALYYGFLVPATNCEVCNSSRYLTAGHHENYYLPLQVNWLCGSCHQSYHAFKQRENYEDLTLEKFKQLIGMQSPKHALYDEFI